MTPLQGKRILVVEDEPIVAMTLEDILLDLGAEVVGPAGTLERALKLAEQGGFDAGILDVNLNGRQSFEVARLLLDGGVPFVFATGYGAAGCQGFPGIEVVQKPYRQQEIAAAVARALFDLCREA